MKMIGAYLPWNLYHSTKICSKILGKLKQTWIDKKIRKKLSEGVHSEKSSSI